MQKNRPSRAGNRDARKERRGSKKLAQTAETSESENNETSDIQDTTVEAVEIAEAADIPALTVEEEIQVSDESKQRLDASAGPRRMERRPLHSLRASVAVVSGRTAGALSRRLHLGGGTSIAGLVAQRVYPEIVEHLAMQLQQGSLLVTGTNGKTTTSGFIAAILSDAGLRVWRNREGSNLMGGIAGALVIRTRPNGRLRRSGQAISIFEVDEAVMPQVVRTVQARVAVFTNLFRDQLDRYGEVDTVMERWQRAVGMLTEQTILVLNADDPSVASLSEGFAGQVLYYGIDDPSLSAELEGTGERHQVIDTRTCPRCGGEYTYSVRFYSHIGHYTCEQCGYSRPQPTIRATAVQTESFDRLRIQVETPDEQGELVVPLPGLYNIYNALAAIAVAQALHIAWPAVVSGIEQFKPAFGRGERVQMENRTLRMLLAKNPTGFNEVLRTLNSGSNKKHVLFVLNDNIADGRDISWIWDIDFEMVLNSFATVSVAGTRARDLALRLKYAGLDPQALLIAPAAPLRIERKERESRGAALRRRAGAARRGARKGELPSAELSTQAQETLPEQALTASSEERVYGIGQALDKAIARIAEGETLFIVPTYTGLLEIHRELERRGLTPHYWEETGP